MSRIIFYCALFYAGYLLAKHFTRKLNQHNRTSEQTKKQPESMVLCTYCQTHVPESEAQLVDNKYICKHQPCKT
jgi:hypothetical protein